MAIVLGWVSTSKKAKILEAGYDEATMQEIETVMSDSTITHFEKILHRGNVRVAIWVDCDVDELLDLTGQ